MGTVRGHGALFIVYPRDHARSGIPDVHARVGDAEVIIELMPDRSARLSDQHPVQIRGNAKRSDVKKALVEAARCYDLIIEEYERQL
jgi:hypothetical protein